MQIVRSVDMPQKSNSYRKYKKIRAALMLSLSLCATSSPNVLAGELSSMTTGSVFEQYSQQKQESSFEKGKVEYSNKLDLARDCRWSKDHRLGVEALRQHQYDLAQKHLLKAATEAKKKLSMRGELMEIRLDLARLYLKQDRYADALRIYDQNLSRLEKESDKNHLREYLIEAHIGIGRSLIEFGKEKAALVHFKKALALLTAGKDSNSQLYGYAIQGLGLVNAKSGWYEDARPLFKEALKIFESQPGYNALDLAGVLREQALFYHGRGERRLTRELYERSYKIKEKIVAANRPHTKEGQVRFVWEPGSSRAKEIIDTEFPFRYLGAGNIRVAATVIDLWELLAVLITVTNTGDKQEEFELGKVSLLKLDNAGGRTEFETINPVNPRAIDRIRRERVMWDLTHTRPWLANIQKTRTVRGLVPEKGHDLFRGPNVFGVYREWEAISHIVPARVGVLVSREGLYSSTSNQIARVATMPGMLRSGGDSIKDHVPVFLEPFESRTGDIFYLNPRDKDIILKIPVGNAIFEIPFHTRKAKIP